MERRPRSAAGGPPPVPLLVPVCLLLTAAAARAAPAVCQYGQHFLDQCKNQCMCQPGGSYSCTEKGCTDGVPGQPMRCEVEGLIPGKGGWPSFCRQGIVRVEPSGLPRWPCTPGAVWKEGCGTCECSESRTAVCSRQECSDPDQATLQGGGGYSSEGGTGDGYSSGGGTGGGYSSGGGSGGGYSRSGGGYSSGGGTGGGYSSSGGGTGGGYSSSGGGTGGGYSSSGGGTGGGYSSSGGGTGGGYSSGGQHADIAARRYCEGPCPADCREALDEVRRCLACRCRPPKLQFGDLTVPAELPCPDGLRTGPTLFATTICRGQDCQPGSQWTVHHDHCSKCVCTRDRDPACTPCQRTPTESTVTCGGPCPQDCRRAYNAGKDCYECSCGAGKPGNVYVDLHEPCPPGTEFRESGAFFTACGALDTLPKGDTKVCDLLQCPVNCATVRVSREEGCVYCQCGPVLAPGDQLVPIGRRCPPTSLPGPIQPATRVCRAPTREECKPGTEYNLGCDVCLCQEDGVPACTLRNCSLPEYTDLPDCSGGYMHCGQVDCESSEVDGHCRLCQCGTGQYGEDAAPPDDTYPPPAPPSGEDATGQQGEDAAPPVDTYLPPAPSSGEDGTSQYGEAVTAPEDAYLPLASPSGEDSLRGQPRRRYGHKDSSEEDGSEDGVGRTESASRGPTSSSEEEDGDQRSRRRHRQKESSSSEEEEEDSGRRPRRRYGQEESSSEEESSEERY